MAFTWLSWLSVATCYEGWVSLSADDSFAFLILLGVPLFTFQRWYQRRQGPDRETQGPDSAVTESSQGEQDTKE